MIIHNLDNLDDNLGYHDLGNLRSQSQQHQPSGHLGIAQLVASNQREKTQLKQAMVLGFFGILNIDQLAIMR